MNKKYMGKTTLLIIVLLVAIGGGLYFTSNSKNNTVLTVQEKSMMIENKDTKKDAPVMTGTNPNNNDTMVPGDQDVMMKSGTYEKYS